MSSLGKRLEYILDMKQIKKADLSKVLNKSPSTISGYINDSRSPDLETLKNISDYLNINVGYLLMQTDNYTLSKDKKFVCITVDGNNLCLTDKDVEKAFNKLQEIGFDINKLLK